MLYAKFSKHIFILSLDLTILDCIFLCGNFAPCFGLDYIWRESQGKLDLGDEGSFSAK